MNGTTQSTADKPANTYRIFVLGGSTVFCGRLPYEQTHCALMQERLQAANPDVKIEVLNAGVSGDTSAGGLARTMACFPPKERQCCCSSD